jgi:hypothetical protein
MKHKHRIIPGHMGGEYVEGNVIDVEVTQCDGKTANHAMWHFANWQLWGKVEDKLAWEGLAGFMGREEIIAELMQIGRDKGKAGREAAIKEMFENGTHPFLSPDLIERRRSVNSKCMIEYNQSPEGRAKSSSTATRTNSRKEKCPHCDFASNPGNLAKHVRQSHQGKSEPRRARS